MSLAYHLTIGGDTPLEQVAARAWPALDERPTGTFPMLSVDLVDRYGFSVNVRAGQHGYVDALADEGEWEWEPSKFVYIAFHLNKNPDFEALAINMLLVVRRVLSSGPEDAALVLNGDILILTRFNGEVVKHNREKWWSYYPAAEQLFPG